MIKNKKGFELLGEHTVNLIIAVLCIIVLIYLGMALFGYFKDTTRLQQAKSSMDDFLLKSNSLKEVGDSAEVMILSPADWWLSVWPQDNQYPFSCGTKSCICFSREIPYPKDFSKWNTESASVCWLMEGKNLNLKTDYFYRLLDCNAEPESYYQIVPPLTLKLSLKQNNELYIEQKC